MAYQASEDHYAAVVIQLTFYDVLCGLRELQLFWKHFVYLLIFLIHQIYLQRIFFQNAFWRWRECGGILLPHLSLLVVCLMNLINIQYLVKFNTIFSPFLVQKLLPWRIIFLELLGLIFIHFKDLIHFVLIPVRYLDDCWRLMRINYLFFHLPLELLVDTLHALFRNLICLFFFSLFQFFLILFRGKHIILRFFNVMIDSNGQIPLKVTHGFFINSVIAQMQWVYASIAHKGLSQ